MNRPDFIIIPCVLIEDAKINPIDRMVYGFIYWYSKMKNEKCIASNDTLAELSNTTPKTIQHALDRLERSGYIKRTFEDSRKTIRTEIIPLITFKGLGVSTDTTGVSTSTPQGYQRRKLGVSTDTQNKNNTIRIENKNSDWLKKAIRFYSLFWEETYGTKPEAINWGRLGKSLLSLKGLNEWQWATLIWLHFNWYGASGDDKRIHKNLADNFFPLDWLPRASDGYKAYLINTLELKWNDEEAVKKFILPELRKAQWQEK